MPLGRQHGSEAVVIGLVGAAISEEAVAAGYPAICELHEAGAFASEVRNQAAYCPSLIMKKPCNREILTIGGD